MIALALTSQEQVFLLNVLAKRQRGLKAKLAKPHQYSDLEGPEARTDQEDFRIVNALLAKLR